MTPSGDTSTAAQALQLQIQRAMSGEQRLLLAMEMSTLARELSAAGLRDAHPEWAESDIRRELLRLAFLPRELPAALK